MDGKCSAIGSKQFIISDSLTIWCNCSNICYVCGQILQIVVLALSNISAMSLIVFPSFLKFKMVCFALILSSLGFMLIYPFFINKLLNCKLSHYLPKSLQLKFILLTISKTNTK